MNQAKQNSNPSFNGYTLVELLVVVLIVGLLAGLLVLRFNQSPGKQVQQEAARLLQLIHLASDEAQVSGDEYALLLNRSGYRFLRYSGQNNRWISPKDTLFKERSLPGAMALTLWIDNQEVELASVPTPTEPAGLALITAEGDATERQPLILLASSGERERYRIELVHSNLNAAARLVSDGVRHVFLE